MRVALVQRVEKDLRALQPQERRRLGSAMLGLLVAERLPANADDKPLAGHRQWRRLRVGEWRIIWRQGEGVRYVARIVNRRDLERAVKSLGK